MARWQPRSGPPWYGVDDELLRRLEIHETQVHAIEPGRELVDLGDAVALFDAGDPDPFFNRVGAIRWPGDPVAFESSLETALRLFETHQRQPYVWLSPGFLSPGDLPERLRERGFVEVGDGALMMILVEDPRGRPKRDLAPGATLERLTADGPDGGRAGAEAAAIVVAEAFGVSADRVPALTERIAHGVGDPGQDIRLARVDGEPAAVGRRNDSDGMSYLSAIGTRRAFQSRGLAEAVTRALVEEALVAGTEHVYLGAYADNAPALTVYERVGFAVIGGPALELLRP